MSDEIKIEDILKYLREQISVQAQEIAVLKATLDKVIAQRDSKV